MKLMYDPIMRVLTVLEILQARDHVSGGELAARLEVNLRTVQRYIARLQDLSVPVESVRGVGGYYRLKPGFRLPPLMFTDEEAFAVMLGLRSLRHLGLSAFAPATEGAAAKLARVLPCFENRPQRDDRRYGDRARIYGYKGQRRRPRLYENRAQQFLGNRNRGRRSRRSRTRCAARA